MVPQKLKQNIWEDQYIDLAALLPNNLVPGTESENYTFKLDKNSDVAVYRKRPSNQSIQYINGQQHFCVLLLSMLKDFRMKHQSS